ncbi:MAG: hypothetical protein ACLP19_25420 [Xanthobacteraceae bacterium]
MNPVPDGTDQIFLICSTIGRIDHGKEVEGKEEIQQEKGRPGAQEKEDSKIGGKEAGEKSRQEGSRESGQKGCSEAQSGGEEADSGAEPSSRSGARLDPAGQS